MVHQPSLRPLLQSARTPRAAGYAYPSGAWRFTQALGRQSV